MERGITEAASENEWKNRNEQMMKEGILQKGFLFCWYCHGVFPHIYMPSPGVSLYISGYGNVRKQANENIYR